MSQDEYDEKTGEQQTRLNAATVENEGKQA